MVCNKKHLIMLEGLKVDRKIIGNNTDIKTVTIVAQRIWWL